MLAPYSVFAVAFGTLTLLPPLSISLFELPPVLTISLFGLALWCELVLLKTCITYSFATLEIRSLSMSSSMSSRTIIVGFDAIASEFESTSC